MSYATIKMVLCSYCIEVSGSQPALIFEPSTRRLRSQTYSVAMTKWRCIGDVVSRLPIREGLWRHDKFARARYHRAYPM